MTAAAWAALVGWGGAVGLAVTAVILALRIAGLTKEKATEEKGRIAASARADDLAKQLDQVVAELADVKARHTKEVSDLRSDAAQCWADLESGASADQLREQLRRLTLPQPKAKGAG